MWLRAMEAEGLLGSCAPVDTLCVESQRVGRVGQGDMAGPRDVGQVRGKAESPGAFARMYPQQGSRTALLPSTARSKGVSLLA